MAVFQGAGVAIVTPFKANGEVNYDKFAELLEFQIGNGTDAIIVCGTTGESSTLTHEEHLEVNLMSSGFVWKRWREEYPWWQEPVLTVRKQRFIFQRKQKNTGRTRFFW